MTEPADKTLAELPLMTEEEKQQLADWNATEVTFPLDKTWPELFEQQVATTPSAIAAKCGADELRYSELNERAERLAARLHAENAGGQIVAVALERSLDFATAAVGILKAGSTYLPVELASPRERLAEILNDARPALILAHRRFAARLPEDGIKIIWLDDPDSPNVAVAEHHRELTPSSVAYVMYTSGSSGKPKGVQISHRSLVNHNCAVARSFGLTDSDRVLQFSSLGFDISIEEMFPTWLQGGTVVFRPDDALTSLHRFLDFVQQERITVLDIPTAFWHELVDFLPIRTLPESVRLVVIGGERAWQRSFDVWKQHVGQTVRLINTYGPTEGTVTTTQYEACAGDERLPIGRPIANTKTYVLTEDIALCPLGVPGELYIGGASVALGYLNTPDLTETRFVANPFVKDTSDRIYKTGDLVRWRNDGNLEFIGRADQQLKIRGFRVEPGEIEVALTSHPAIAECAVAESHPGVLAAYFAATSSLCPSQVELQSFLRQKLPDYMVPSHFVALDKLPRTPRGKVDRVSLAGMPLERSSDSTYVAPQNTVEARIAEIWCEVLRLEKVGIDDNFFRLGGHSLHAMQVTSRLQIIFGEDIPPSDVFDRPTVRTLALGVFGFIRRRKGRTGGPITRVSRRQNIPLSSAQQRLWFLQQLDPASPAYNIPQAIRLRGDLDVAALESSLAEMVCRHESLRTVFLTVDGRPAQTINPPGPITLAQIDLGQCDEDEVNRRMAVEARRPFDLSRDLMLRTTLFRLSTQEHILLLTIHHIAADAWSLAIALDELTELYRAYSSGNPPSPADAAVQYADFAVWQKGWLQAAPLEEQLDYWKKHLEGAPSLLELPADRPRPVAQSSRGARQRIALNGEFIDKLRRLSEQENCTLFMTLLTAFQSLLTRYTGREDIVIGCPTANRTRPEIERVIGFFVNTLVLRGDTSGNPSFRELLRKTRETTLGAFAHQDLPFEMLVDELRPARDPSYHPLFQVMFVLQNAPAPKPNSDVLSWKPFDVDIGTSKFDLTLELAETENGMEGWFEYSTDLFDAWRMERMAEHFRTLLEGIAAKPDARIADLPLLTADDRRILTEDWNSDRQPFPQDQCIHHLFEAQALRTPDVLAVVSGEEALTYKELNGRADHLAHVLRSLGVGPEVLVGICMERSLEMIVAILGVLKAGGAYVPMDPAYPQDRVAFMIEDAQASVLVTQQRLLSRLPPSASRIVCLDDSRPEVMSELGRGQPPTDFRTPRANNLAYVIYTSGSTGKPKGVAIEHRSAVAMLHWARRAFSDQELSGVLFVTSICFDLSIFEMFAPLSWGGKIVLTDNALQWRQTSAARQVSLVNTVPSLAAEWLRTGELPDSVQTINLAGEPLSQSLVEEIYERWPQVKKVNDLYGPTETTVYSTGSLRLTGGEASIGRVLTNEQVYLLDRNSNLVPIGVPGELYIGGAGLAREYLRRPELTAEKFVPNPFGEGRLYRTGDLVRYRPDGSLEYLGRIDHQVKIRGYRIELGEIEERLREHPQVRECVVVAADVRGGEKRLVAYVAVAPPAPEVVELRALLKQQLPDYMMPGAFVMLDSLPHTPNGKIDRKALPSATDNRSSAGADHVPPGTMTEKMLAEIWADVLGIENIGANDNFFELGGHSLLITKVLARIREAIDLDLPMRVMFEAPTISGLGKAIETALLDEVEQLSEEEAERLDASVKAEERLEELRT